MKRNGPALERRAGAASKPNSDTTNIAASASDFKPDRNLAHKRPALRAIVNNDAEPLKAARFQFHEQVLLDTTLSRAAIRLAGFIMHSYQTKDGASFSFSIRKAAKHLKADRSTMQRACWELEERGHIQRISHGHNRTRLIQSRSPIRVLYPPGCKVTAGGLQSHSRGRLQSHSRFFRLRSL